MSWGVSAVRSNLLMLACKPLRRSYRDFMVLLIAEVARNYLDVRTVEERIVLAKQNIKNQKGSLKLANDRFDAGLAPKQDITQAQTNLSDTQAFLPQLRQQRTTTVNRLAILIRRLFLSCRERCWVSMK